MWLIKSWIYKGRYGKLTFKMRNFTESFQEDCRESVKKEFKGITSKLPNIWTRLMLKDPKQKMHDNFVDILGRSNSIKQPIFTANEVAKFMQNRYAYVGVLLIMLLFETFLYSMLKKILIPRDTLEMYPGIEFAVGFFFALIFVVMLHFAFKFLWEYFEAKYIVTKHKLDKNELKPFYRNFIISILIISIFIIANISTGYLRATYLEPHSNSNTQNVDNTHIAFLLFSILITFGVAFVMALLEKEIAEKSEKIKVFKNWKRQQKERKEYNTQVKDMLKKCVERKDILIEEYWGILKDLQRVFEIEVDADKQHLYTELNDKISKKEIDFHNLDEKIYQHYLPVAATRHELFEYGVDSDQGISDTITDLRKKVAIIEAKEKENATPEKSNGIETTVVEEQNAKIEDKTNVESKENENSTLEKSNGVETSVVEESQM